MEEILREMLEDSQDIINYLPNIMLALIVLVIAYSTGKLAGNILLRFLSKSRLPRTHNLFFRKLVIWVFLFIGFGLALNILGLRAASAGLLTGGGITALAVGFLFKDFGQNILSGMYLAFSRPFDIDDLIKTGEFEGVVKKVELTNTHIRLYNGADVYIPNAQIFGEPLTNYTQDGLRRLSFTVGIDYRDDVAKACNIITERINIIPKTLKNPETQVVISGFNPNYIELKVFFWIDAFDKELKLLEKRNEVMEACRLVLIENNYTFSAEVSSANVLSVPDPVVITNQSV